ncbi:hypothetical protein AB7360_03665 [Providencia alcalifaciens]|uniref:Uncharacterized protein n=1 Tax=Providencia huashanensis TaxID=3037798 RepID=A0AA42JU48_9GAMM|nr:MULTISPECIES: hypothetical protein [Providencia]APC12576.1 hypothetical protein RB151_029180 [Providencia rettgeri]EJD6080709.1 hypothetical protein [Providencia rettgeri]EJD6411180.1 hypothetical protein [Providencia rettgeri]EJD6600203.1 hypothetical protein [Providencia rettgeri]EJD6661536.1 hypothetical protein [Providencia rettgeri]
MNNHHFAIGISLALGIGTLSAQAQSSDDNVIVTTMIVTKPTGCVGPEKRRRL